MTQHKIFIEKLTTLANTNTDKTAITFMREGGNITTTTYSEILSNCKSVKDMLERVGVVAGDRVAIVSPHSPQAVLAALGLEYANVTVVLIDASLPASEINRLLAFADVRALFVTAKLYPAIEQDNKAEMPVFELCGEERRYELFADSVKQATRAATAI